MEVILEISSERAAANVNHSADKANIRFGAAYLLWLS
jgi:hypothetical protein